MTLIVRAVGRPEVFVHPGRRGLTPASPDGLPPLGELVAGDPFWRHRSGLMAGEGVAHLRVWLTAGPEPGRLAMVTETGSADSVTESAGPIWAELTRRYGPPSSCLSTTQPPNTRKARKPSIWSASGPMAARTGPVYGRPRRRIPVTPGWSSGWPPKGTRSPASPRAISASARTRTTDRKERGAAILRLPVGRSSWDAHRVPAPSPGSSESARDLRGGWGRTYHEMPRTP